MLPNAGNVGREQADHQAEREYEAFAVRRRVQAEDAGEAEALRQLEDVARKLPAKTRGKSKTKGKGK